MDGLKNWIEELKEENPMVFYLLIVALAMILISNGRSLFTGKKGAKAAGPASAPSAVAKQELTVVNALPPLQPPPLSDIPEIDIFYLKRLGALAKETMPESLRDFNPVKTVFDPFYTIEQRKEGPGPQKEVERVAIPLPTLKYQGYFILNNEKQGILKDKENRLLYARIGEFLPSTSFRVEEINYRNIRCFDLEFKRWFSVGYTGVEGINQDLSTHPEMFSAAPDGVKTNPLGNQKGEKNEFKQ